MSTLSPTPWTVVAHPDHHGCRIMAADGRSIADCIQRDPHPVHGQGITQERAETHGRLFAAAPQLLEALQAEDEWRRREEDGAIDPDWNYEQMVGNKRRAAIALATGATT